MDFNKKIKEYAKASDSKYGLESDGSFYEVINEFYLEVLEGYEKTEEKYSGFNLLKPIWKELKAMKKDLLLISNKSAFIKPDGSSYYIECKPKESKNKETPNLSRFSENNIKKIGKKLERTLLMNKEEIKKIILIRSI
jgi:hypothetical protein